MLQQPVGVFLSAAGSWALSLWSLFLQVEWECFCCSRWPASGCWDGRTAVPQLRAICFFLERRLSVQHLCWVIFFYKLSNAVGKRCSSFCLSSPRVALCLPPRPPRVLALGHWAAGAAALVGSVPWARALCSAVQSLG